VKKKVAPEGLTEVLELGGDLSKSIEVGSYTAKNDRSSIYLGGEKKKKRKSISP